MYIESITPQNTSGWSVISCGPGGMPCSSSAPNITAIVPLAGMPSVRSGMNEEVAAALLAVSGEATPSTAPLPKRCGLLRDALLHGVGDEGGHRRAAAGQDAQDEADHASRGAIGARDARRSSREG